MVKLAYGKGSSLINKFSRDMASRILATGITVLSSGLAGCSEEKTSGSGAGTSQTCQDAGTLKCSGNLLLECVETNEGKKWILNENCAQSNKVCASDNLGGVCNSASTMLSDGGSTNANSTSCGTGAYKCEDNVLYRCSESQSWTVAERCGTTAAVCDATLPGCRQADAVPHQRCETREVDFNCGSMDGSWSYSRGMCGSTSEDCHYVRCSISNLCGNDNYASPVLRSGFWISVVFDDLESLLGRLILTYVGRHDPRDNNYRQAEVKVEELPPKSIAFTTFDVCDSPRVVFEGQELFNESRQENVATDSQLTINLNGKRYTQLWVSGLVATFCYPETKPGTCTRSHVCRNNVLYSCDRGTLSEQERCSENSICNAESQNCVPKQVPQETCEVREVEFSCSTRGTNWEYSNSCSINDNPDPAYRLCGGDDYNSPSLTSGGWISATISNVRSGLTKLVVTYLGKKYYPDGQYDGDALVQIDQTPSKGITLPRQDVCEPASVVFEGNDLLNPDSLSVASDGQVVIKLNGTSNTRLWASRAIFTFCYSR